jgi:hypothetical protein
VYLDLDADNYRMATNKITDWRIKWVGKPLFIILLLL